MKTTCTFPTKNLVTTSGGTVSVNDYSEAVGDYARVLLENQKLRDENANLREALKTVLDWDMQSDPNDHPKTQDRFLKDLKDARGILANVQSDRIPGRSEDSRKQ